MCLVANRQIGYIFTFSQPNFNVESIWIRNYFMSLQYNDWSKLIFDALLYSDSEGSSITLGGPGTTDSGLFRQCVLWSNAPFCCFSVTAPGEGCKWREHACTPYAGWKWWVHACTPYTGCKRWEHACTQCTGCKRWEHARTQYTFIPRGKW